MSPNRPATKIKKEKKGRKIDWDANVHGQKNHVCLCMVTSQGPSIKKKHLKDL
jgi:hypothetical protein